MKKKTWAIIISAVLVIALAVTGTFAWLTDRDSEVNVFTMGDVDIDLTEDFEQGAVLTPGVKIEKVPTITNTGKNDAWVWMTVAIPAALDNLSGDGQNGSNLNVVHWNCTGATWEGLVAQNYVDSAIAKGLLPAGTTAEQIIAAKTTWNVNNKVAPYQQTINNVSYNVYTLLYNKAITKGESTLPGFIQLFMDATVDIDPDGNLAKVVNGVVTPINWNINTDGAPVVYVSAYATQAEGFADVKAAYDAYQAQWGANGGAEVAVPAVVNDDASLKAAIDAGAEVIILESGNYGVIDVRVNRNLTLSAAANADVKIAGINGQSNNNSTNVTIKDVTIDNSLQTEGWYIGTSKNIKPCVGVWGGNYTFENCTFYVTGASGAETGVMSWWTTNKGVMNFTNCTFNGGNSSARGMQIYGNYDLNVTNCTFNTEKDYSIKYVGADGCVATFKNNNVSATTNFVQTGSASYAGANYALVFENNTLASGINHVFVDNAEGQTITVNGVVKAATAGAIY